MGKIVLLITFLFSFALYAEDLKITSNYFSYNMKQKQSVFKGDVKAVKGDEYVKADKMVVFFNEKKKPVKFEASGHVKFKIVMDKNTTYTGSSDKLIYLLKSGNIILLGNAKIVKVQTNESIKGDKIVLNRFTKNAEVVGKKKPVEIILKVNE